MNPEMKGAAWADWFLGPKGKAAWDAALMARGLEPDDRYVGEASLPPLLSAVEAAADAVQRLRKLQAEEGATAEQRISADAVLDAVAGLDAALVHERFYTASGDCPCRNCRRRR